MLDAARIWLKRHRAPRAQAAEPCCNSPIPGLFLLLPLPLLMHWLAPAHQEPRLAVYVPFMRILARVAGGTAAAGTVITRRRRLQLVQIVLAWLRAS